MRIENSTFVNSREVLDGNEYIKCRFDNCELVFSASAPVSLVGCSFKEVRWAFAGAAALTMEFLGGLYHGAGEGGKALVEKTFADIRKSKPTRQ